MAKKLGANIGHDAFANVTQAEGLHPGAGGANQEDGQQPQCDLIEHSFAAGLFRQHHIDHAANDCREDQAQASTHHQR